MGGLYLADGVLAIGERVSAIFRTASSAAGNDRDIRHQRRLALVDGPDTVVYVTGGVA